MFYPLAMLEMALKMREIPKQTRPKGLVDISRENFQANSSEKID